MTVKRPTSMLCMAWLRQHTLPLSCPNIESPHCASPHPLLLQAQLKWCLQVKNKDYCSASPFSPTCWDITAFLPAEHHLVLFFNFLQSPSQFQRCDPWCIVELMQFWHLFWTLSRETCVYAYSVLMQLRPSPPLKWLLTFPCKACQPPSLSNITCRCRWLNLYCSTHPLF